MIKDEKGHIWQAQNIETPKDERGQVYDAEIGGDLLVRTFRILTDPTKEPDPLEVLDFHRQSVLDFLYRDGWKLERDLMVGKVVEEDGLKDGLYDIIAVCSPMEKHGSIVGVQNDQTKNVSEILIKEKEAQNQP